MSWPAVLSKVLRLQLSVIMHVYQRKSLSVFYNAEYDKTPTPTEITLARLKQLVG